MSTRRGGARARGAATSVVTSVVTAGLAAATACNVVLDTDVEQCLVDADCDARGGAFAGRVCQDRVCRPRALDDGGADAGPEDPVLGCVGRVSWPIERSDARVRFRQRFTSLLGAKPVEGAEVLACSTLDPTCATPVATTTTDARGDAILDLPVGFRGYLHFPKAPPSLPDLLPHLYAVLPPPAVDMPITPDVPMSDVWQLVTANELNLLLAQIGSSVDPEFGHIVAQTIDCRGVPLAGVTARANVSGPKTVEYYFTAGDLPSDKATETSASGVFGFINVPPGPLQIDTQLVGQGRRHGNLGVLVKKGWVTLVPFYPTP